EDQESLFRAASEYFKSPVHIMVNNAGVGEGTPFPANTADDWIRVVDVDLTAVILGTRLALSHFEQHEVDEGVIVSTASLAGLINADFQPVYAAAKAGVVNFSRSLGYLKNQGVRVTCVCPAFSPTNMTAEAVKRGTAMRLTAGIKIAEWVPVDTVIDAFMMGIQDRRVAGEALRITVKHGIDLPFNRKLDAALKAQARLPFCGGRLKKWEWHLLLALISANVILVIMLPVAYFIIIPGVVQATLNDLGTHTNNLVTLRDINVGRFGDSSLDIGVNMVIDPVVPLPVRVGLRETAVFVTDQNGNVIANTVVPPLDFWVNSHITVDVTTNVTFDSTAQTNMRKLLGQLSSGVSDLQIVVHLKAPITVFGITLYAGLPLYKKLDLGSVETSLQSFVAMLDRIASSFAPASFEKTGDALKSNFAASDVVSLAESFSVVWSNLTVAMNDDGLGADLGFALENGAPFTVTGIPAADFYLELQNVSIAHIKAKQLVLQSGVQSLPLGVDVTFLDEKMAKDNFANALTAASLSFAQSGDFVFSIVGPVNIPSAPFITEITRELRFDVSLSDLLALNLGSDTKMADVFSLSGVESILGNSSIALNVASNEISIPLGLALPNLAPIPRRFEFPYVTSLDIVGATTPLLHSVVSPISLARTNVAITVNTSVTVLPTNTQQAAQELADAVNPILAFEPKTSQIGFGNLAFASGNSSNFKWAQELFGGRNITIHLPAIDKEAAIDSMLASSADFGITSAVRDLITVNRIDISQLGSKPGFGVDGNVVVAYPAGLPQIRVELGYFNLDVTVESSMLADLELPAGLKFYPQASGTSIQATASLGTDASIVAKVQKIVNSFADSGASPSYAGITGLLMGSSSSQPLVTFSKVAIDLSVATIQNIISKATSDTSLSSLLPSGLATLHSADLAVTSASAVKLTVGTLIKNPSKISLSVGSFGASFQLDHTTLLSVSLNPISVGLGNTQMALDVSVSMRNSENGSANKLGTVVAAYQNDDTSLGLPVGATGVTLGNINQFSSVSVAYPVGKLLALLKSQSSTTGLVDFSALIPTQDAIFKSSQPKVGYVLINALANSLLQLGIDVDYKNVLP
ncbi:hypothetical protein HDU91_007181, partial [Kappamyces sp. JEL0680]